MPVVLVLIIIGIFAWLLSHKGSGQVNTPGSSFATGAIQGVINAVTGFGSNFPSRPIATPASPVAPIGQQLPGQAQATTNGLVSYLKKWEGLVFQPKPDAGKFEIGYGHQIQPGEPYGQGIDQATADQLLAKDSQFALSAVDNLVTVPLTNNQRSALADLVYNIGYGNFASSDVLSNLNQGNYDAATNALENFIYSSGQPNQGLVNRRIDEVNLFWTPDTQG